MFFYQYTETHNDAQCGIKIETKVRKTMNHTRQGLAAYSQAKSDLHNAYTAVNPTSTHWN